MKMMYRDALRRAIDLKMASDETLFMTSYDIGKYGGEHRISGNLWEKYGDARVKDAPISEQGIIGMAIGASITGCRAIAEIPFMDFMPMCMDMITNQAAKIHHMFGGKIKVPVVILTSMGGYIQAAQQHSQCLESWVAHVPGLKTVIPSTAADAEGLMKTAIDDNSPVIFVNHKRVLAMKFDVPDVVDPIPFGKADVKREGTDITVIATAFTLHQTLHVAEKLAAESISVEVVDPRTLVPLDEELILSSVAKTRRVVIAHEAHVHGGAGAEIAAIISEQAFDALDAPIRRVGAKWSPIPFPSVLENYVLPQESDIEAAIRATLDAKRSRNR